MNACYVLSLFVETLSLPCNGWFGTFFGTFCRHHTAADQRFHAFPAMQYPSQPCHPAPSIMPPTRLPRQCLPAFQEARPGPLPGTGHRERGPSPSRARRGNGDRMKEAPADSTGPGLHGKDADPGDTPHRGPDAPGRVRACWGTDNVPPGVRPKERQTDRGVPNLAPGLQ